MGEQVVEGEEGGDFIHGADAGIGVGFGREESVEGGGFVGCRAGGRRDDSVRENG